MSPEAFHTYHRRLPHWRLAGATYFVTWRLSFRQADLTPRERSMVASSLQHFDGERYDLHGYVIMNDHAHVLVSPRGHFELQAIVHSWKSFAARQLQRTGRWYGRIWQDESHDRIVRNATEFRRKLAYIRNNPLKRWPGIEGYGWVWVKGGVD